MLCDVYWQIIVGTAVISVGYYFYKKQSTPVIMSVSDVRDHRVETVKNALLTFALSRIRSSDFEDFNMNYAAYDGSKLPMMSGSDLNNALCSYIMSKDDFRKAPLYSKHMENKITAIEKYLEKHFDTDSKVRTFVAEFVRSCEKHTDEIQPCPLEEEIQPDNVQEVSTVEEEKPDEYVVIQDHIEESKI